MRRSPRCRRCGAFSASPACRCRCGALFWWFGLNNGRQRANNFGTFAITVAGDNRIGEPWVLNSPGPSMMTYGLVRPDNTMEILLHWDHRIYDGVLAARALQKLEDVMNGEIADELLASAKS